MCRTISLKQSSRIRQLGSGDGAVLGFLLVGSLAFGLFFVVKDWIKDTKDARHGLGEYAYEDESLRKTKPIEEPTMRHFGSYQIVTY